MNNFTNSNLINERKVIDIALKLVLVFILVAWCAMIVLPFVSVLLWSAILAITLQPLYNTVRSRLNGKKGISATLISLLMLVLLLVPFILLLSSMYEEAREIASEFRNDTLVIPPPDAKVATWPLIGPKLYEGWKALNENLEATIIQYKDQITSVGHKVIQSLMSIVSNILMFSASIIIAGILMAFSDQSEKAMLQLFTKLAGDKGSDFMMMVVQTVRNVAKGIIGVAFIQFVIMGIIFLLAGVPFAGLWGLIVLMLALVQLPTFIVALPVIIYIYSVKDPVQATVWAAVLLLAGLSDNVLKPWLMGKGAPVPMLVIFLGSVGGFIMSGFIGLFTGAIVLSLGYKLFVMWLESEKETYLQA